MLSPHTTSTHQLPLNVLLTADSPREEATLGKTLRPHQAAALARCRSIEAGRIDFMSTGNEVYRDLYTRVAALCDATGSGKSLTVLALCAGESPSASEKLFAAHCDGLVGYTIHPPARRRVPTSVIVVPHGILSQWSQYLDDSGVSGHVFARRTAANVEALGEAILGDDCPRVVLCTSTNYGTVQEIFESMHLCADRLIVDEADTIVLGNASFLSARMYWSVTASVKVLLNPAGIYSNSGCATSRRIVSGAVFDLWRGVMLSPARGHIIVRSSDDFVASSLALDPARNFSICCKAPPGTSVLKGLVEKDVMRALETDDLPRAMALLDNRGSEDNIVEGLREKWSAEIAYGEKLISRLVELSYPETDVAVKDQKRRIEVRRSWMATLDQRVRGDQVCAICFDAPVNKTLLPCCSSMYCMGCITKWLSKKDHCPSCRAKEVSIRHAHVVSDVPCDRVVGKLESAVELIDSILASSAERRVMLCCSNEGVYESFSSRLKGEHGLTHLKGSASTVVQKANAFRDGRKRVLFMSEDCYCTGINLPFVTDVVLFHDMDSSAEAQMVGRAHRPGRECRLNVWRLKHAFDPKTKGEVVLALDAAIAQV